MKQKQKVCGIIVEYNPFHYGHLHHLKKAKEISGADIIIAAMSPNFVQRGEPAIVNKWERAKTALKNGVDIVVEIPTPYVLQRADIFVQAGLKVLSYMGVNSLVYGSETNTKQNIGRFDFESMNSGASYASSANPDNLGPNDLLGALYEKYSKQYNIETFTIKRTQGYKDLTLESNIVSATAIRNAIKSDLKYKNKTPMVLKNSTFHFIDDYEPYLNYLLIKESNDTLRNLLLMDEGIENLFKKLRTNTTEDLINKSTSKRYTRSRIQRTLMNALLNNTKKLKPFPKKARILGMSKLGQKYLSNNKDNLQYTSSFKDYEYKDIEMKSSEIYSLPYGKKYLNDSIKQEKGKPIIVYK